MGTLLASVINIVLNYIMIPRYGYFFAVIATLIAYFGNCLFHYIVVKYIFGDPLIYGRKVLHVIALVIFASIITFYTTDKLVVRYLSFFILVSYCSVNYRELIKRKLYDKLKMIKIKEKL